MVDDVKDITETADAKAASEALDRARLARERREAEQRKRLDELRAHAAAAQAQREKRDEDRRRRQAEQRARDDDRRQQVEERKRAIWEASISRRETLLQREKERTERLEKQRAAKSSPRPAYAFGSSTPRLLEPLDSAGFFWAARSTNPIDQMNFFESLAASTTNVMFASAPLTRRASALQLDATDNDNKDESDRQQTAIAWSSVARRRTDLVPTIPASRAPGRAYSMTRLDRIPNRISCNSPSMDRITNRYSPSMDRINKCSPSVERVQKYQSPKQHRSGESTPTGSRPGSAMSNSTVVRRVTTVRRPRPASIAGTGVNTPRGTNESQSIATTPSVSRDPSTHAVSSRRPRPLSVHTPSTPLTPGEGKPPVHRKPKPSKDHDKTPRNKSLSASPGRTLSPSPAVTKEHSVDKETPKPAPPSIEKQTSQVCPKEVTEKLEALQIQHEDVTQVNDCTTITEVKEVTESNNKEEAKPDVQTKETKPQEKPSEEKLDNKDEKKEEKIEEVDMTASMISRKITTEEEAKAALAERRRRAREELERHAQLERERLQREAEEEAERQRLEKERERKEEEEARELAALQRRMDEEKLRKAIEAQQQLEREESERKAREEAERQSRLQEEEEKRRQAVEAERVRKLEAEREEKERNARRQRVEAIMARTRRKKQEEEEKKALESKAAQAPVNNGNVTGDLLGMDASQAEDLPPPMSAVSDATLGAGDASASNGNVADLKGLSDSNHTEDKPEEQFTKPTLQAEPTPATEPNVNNGNVQHTEPNVGHISANFIQTERMTSEIQTKLPEKMIEEDFSTHNGHGTTHNHPLTLQNAI